jgi:integrase
VFQGLGFISLFHHYMTQKFTNRVRDLLKSVQTLRKMVATELAIALQKALTSKVKISAAQPQPVATMGLISAVGGRKYLNAAERKRFHSALSALEPKPRAFCLLLLWSGCRITEALSISASSFDLESGVVSFETLKRRMRGIVRQVPLPPWALSEFDVIFDVSARQRDAKLAGQKLWRWSRSTAWRHVKRTMKAADISGLPASPKGLRHAFGVAAFQVVPPHLVQRWLGHASLRTTAIYGSVVGPEEISFAERVWRNAVVGL